MKLWFHQFMLLSPPLGTSFQALTQYHRHLAVVLGRNLDSRMFWRTTTGLYRHEVLTALHLGNGMSGCSSRDIRSQSERGTHARAPLLPDLH